MTGISGCSEDVRPCRMCGGEKFTRLFSAPGFDDSGAIFGLAECRSCGLVRTEPVLSEDELGPYYARQYYGGGLNKFSGPFERLIHRFNVKRARHLLARLPEPSPRTGRQIRVLDLGCGRADLLKVFHRMGCEAYGIERGEFPVDEIGSGINYYRESLEAVGFEDDFFDLGVMWHVIEHLSEPGAALGEMARVLRPGGLLALAAPNFGGLQAGLFGPDWFHLDLPRHTHHFSKDVLIKHLGGLGFGVVYETTASAEQNLYGFIQSVLNKVVPLGGPNALYSLLKDHRGPGGWAELLAWSAAAGLIFPTALAEHLYSWAAGRGATTIVYAVKGDGRC